MSTERIRSAVLHGIGRTPRHEPFPAPAPTDDAVVVTVTAAALKPSDRLMAEGVHHAPASLPHVAHLPAMALRKASLLVAGSGSGGQASLAESAAYPDLLHGVSTGEILFDVETVPLADVETAWARGTGERRIVLAP